MINAIAEKEKPGGSVLFTQVVDNIGYLMQDQFYLEASVLYRAAREQGCKKLRAVVAEKDIDAFVNMYDTLMQKGFNPVEIIRGGIYVLEKRII